MDTQTITTNQTQSIQVPEKAVTSSMWAAAFAIARGARLLDILPPEGRYARYAFLLSNEGDVTRMALEEYRWGNPSVSLRDLIDARGALIESLHAAKSATHQTAARG